MKNLLLILLTLAVGLFLADGTVSLLDSSLGLLFGIHVLAPAQAFVSFLSLITSVLVYVLMGLTPMIPKRFFLPLALFCPMVLLATIPLSIFFFAWLPQISWLLSLVQVLLGLGVVVGLRRGTSARRLIPEDRIGGKAFGWLNLSVFVLANLCVVLPGVLLYLAWCGSMAVDHFSGGFLALRADSLTVQSRKYERPDGKSIQLIPMMHIGEPGFYQKVLKSVPTNSVILLEGVTDKQNLLKQKISYERMATSLGLSEQHEEFDPVQRRTRQADVDVAQFSERSLELLRLVTLIHAQGLTANVLSTVLQKSQDPHVADQLWDDLLTRRNAHLLQEIKAELLKSDALVVPWGAAHMPGLAEEIRKSGFQAGAAQEYTVFHYRTVWNRLRGLK